MRATAEFVYSGERDGARRPKSTWGEFSSQRYGGMALRTLDLGSSDWLIFEHADRPRRGAGEGRALVGYSHLHLLQAALGRALEALPACFARVPGSHLFRATEAGWAMAAEGGMVVADGLHNGAQLALAPDILPAEGEEESADPAGEPAVRLYVNGLAYASAAPYEAFRAFETFYGNFDLAAYSRQAMAIAAANGAVGQARGPAARPPPRRL